MTTDNKTRIKVFGTLFFFILIIIYAIFTSKDLIWGIKIKNVNIVDGSTVTESTQKITGNARNAVKITLNGREISIDQEGNWSETIALLPGYNVINIKAEDKFGYVDEKNYKLIYKVN